MPDFSPFGKIQVIERAGHATRDRLVHLSGKFEIDSNVEVTLLRFRPGIENLSHTPGDSL